MNRFLFAITMISARYFIFAGIFYLFFYIVNKNSFIHLKIQNKFPKSKMIISEALFSMQTMIIFALIATLIHYLIINEYSMVYMKISDYGTVYFLLSIALLILIHDCYFYFSHKLIHPKKFLDSFIGKILLSSTHHNIHHSRSKSNFGLYFTFWDKIMKTEDENYKITYKKIKTY